MNYLDGDKQPLTNSRGELRKRDIVQFVEFNKYKDSILSGTDSSEEVLKEIPRQVEEYYQIYGKFYEKKNLIILFYILLIFFKNH